jgi:hypothetical protein
MPQDRAQRTNRTFGLISFQRPKLGFLLDAAWPLLVWFTESVFREDRTIVEAEQRAHDAQGADWNQEVFPPHRRSSRRSRPQRRAHLDGSATPFRATLSTGHPTGGIDQETTNFFF